MTKSMIQIKAPVDVYKLGDTAVTGGMRTGINFRQGVTFGHNTGGHGPARTLQRANGCHRGVAPNDMTSSTTFVKDNNWWFNHVDCSNSPSCLLLKYKLTHSEIVNL